MKSSPPSCSITRTPLPRRRALKLLRNLENRAKAISETLRDCRPVLVELRTGNETPLRVQPQRLRSENKAGEPGPLSMESPTSVILRDRAFDRLSRHATPERVRSPRPPSSICSGPVSAMDSIGHQRQHAGQRDAHPRRPVIQLIGQFIRRLYQAGMRPAVYESLPPPGRHDAPLSHNLRYGTEIPRRLFAPRGSPKAPGTRSLRVTRG